QKVALRIELAVAEVGKEHVITPLSVERNKGGGYAGASASHEQVLRGVAGREHQIRAGIRARGMEDLRPNRVGVVTKARLANINDIVGNVGCGDGQRRRKEQTQQCDYRIT